MGYAILMVHCVACGTPFGCNPHKVPSVRRTPDGPREPLCRSCADGLNERYVAAGREPVPIQPDAYDALPEEEL